MKKGSLGRFRNSFRYKNSKVNDIATVMELLGEDVKKQILLMNSFSEEEIGSKMTTNYIAIPSGPLITTINDLVAVVTYYGLAWLLILNLLHE